MYNNNDSLSIIKNSLENNVTYIIYDSCISYLNKMNITDKLYISKLEFNTSLSSSSAINNTKANGNLVSFLILNPQTGVLINIAEYCAEQPFIVKFPVPENTNINLNKQSIINLQKEGYNTLNSSSNFYQDRCLLYYENIPQMQLTLYERRKKYFNNETAGCSEGCSFLELDKNGYIACICLNTTSYISITITNSIMIAISTLNYDVIMCIKEVIKKVFLF